MGKRGNMDKDDFDGYGEETDCLQAEYRVLEILGDYEALQAAMNRLAQVGFEIELATTDYLIMVRWDCD